MSWIASRGMPGTHGTWRRVGMWRRESGRLGLRVRTWVFPPGLANETSRARVRCFPGELGASLPLNCTLQVCTGWLWSWVMPRRGFVWFLLQEKRRQTFFF